MPAGLNPFFSDRRAILFASRSTKFSNIAKELGVTEVMTFSSAQDAASGLRLDFVAYQKPGTGDVVYAACLIFGLAAGDTGRSLRSPHVCRRLAHHGLTPDERDFVTGQANLAMVTSLCNRLRALVPDSTGAEKRLLTQERFQAIFAEDKPSVTNSTAAEASQMPAEDREHASNLARA